VTKKDKAIIFTPVTDEWRITVEKSGIKRLCMSTNNHYFIVKVASFIPE